MITSTLLKKPSMTRQLITPPSGPHPTKPKLPSAEKQKQRSTPPAEVGLPVYKTGQKSEPGVVRTVDIETSDAVQKKKKKKKKCYGS